MGSPRTMDVVVYQNFL